jgi:hypothetical protein
MNPKAAPEATPRAATSPGGGLETESLVVLQAALERLSRGFASLPPIDSAPGDRAALERILFEVAERMGGNFPYFHPLYAGQMQKAPHPIARLAYALALWINPNNHSLDGGRVSSQMEKEAVAEIARMFGWETHLSHLTGSGTIANLEALWVAGRLAPGRTVVASTQAHYTHARISGVLALPVEAIAVDPLGRMDLDALRTRLDSGGVGTVVATIGTTAIGSVDPLPELIELRERYGFRLHADAAYGGYFGLADNLGAAARRTYDRLGEADSIVIDPHKHGLQPYGCGCVLFRDPSVGRFYKHDSPYTYFSSAELHLGEISLSAARGRRRGVVGDAAPAAAHARRRVCARSDRRARGGPDPGRADPRRSPVRAAVHARAGHRGMGLPRTGREHGVIARRIFEEAARRDLHLALAELPMAFFAAAAPGMKADQPTVTCLRSVLMKPEHRTWMDAIWAKLGEATDAVAR